MLSCDEFGGADSKKSLELFAYEESRWPTVNELQTIQCPWQHDGPLEADAGSGSRDFFSRYCGFAPSAEAEAVEAHDAALNVAGEDGVSIASSEASGAMRLAQASRPRDVPTALLIPRGKAEPVLCIPLSKRVLAMKCGWSADDRDRMFESVRNKLRRSKQLFSPADALSPELTTLVARYRADFQITIQASTTFVPVAEVDKLLLRGVRSAAAAEGGMNDD